MQCEEVKFCGQAGRGEGGAGGGVVAVRLGGAALCVQQSLLLEISRLTTSPTLCLLSAPLVAALFRGLAVVVLAAAQPGPDTVRSHLVTRTMTSSRPHPALWAGDSL